MEKIIVEYGSPEYDETLQLRTEVLRKPLGLEFTEEQLAKEYTDIHLAITDASSSIIACLILTPLDNEVIKMRQVAVNFEFQGQGLGKSLVSYAEEVAKYYGFQKMELNARDTAVPFYLSMQYTIDGDPFVEVGIAHSFMFKNL